MLDGDRDSQGSQGFVCRNVIPEDVRFMMSIKNCRQGTIIPVLQFAIYS